MAQRGSSVPANPFWSQRIREEVALQALRPLDLPSGDVAVRQPVPESDEEELRVGSEDGPGIQPVDDGNLPGRGRTRSRQGRDRFSTPASWTTREVAPRTAGPMPTTSEGLMTEGPSPGVEAYMEESDLQRALEKEVVLQLHEENMRLKKDLDEMRQQRGKGVGTGPPSGSWSEVTATSHGVPEVAQPTTPTRPTAKGGGRMPRFTPGGTQVPMDTPPEETADEKEWVMPPMPPWPWQGYEPAAQDGPCKATLGPSATSGASERIPGMATCWTM